MIVGYASDAPETKIKRIKRSEDENSFKKGGI